MNYDGHSFHFLDSYQTPFVLFSYEQVLGKVNDVYFLVAKTTHETPFNLPNAAVYLAVEKKSKPHPRTSCQSFDKKLVFFTSYDCNWQPYKDESLGNLLFFQIHLSYYILFNHKIQRIKQFLKYFQISIL